MPPKRKSIGRSTSQGRSKKISRASESVQQRDARLEADRIQTAQARSNETVQQRKARLEDNRIQTAQGRSNETVQQRKARLEDNRLQTVQARSNETVQQRKARLEDNRIQTAQARSNETVQQRKARLEDNRLQTAQARSNETVQQRKARLEDNRLQTAQGRSNETVQQRKARLEDNRLQTAQGRSNETVQQRKARLEDNRLQTAQGRSNETVQQRKARLEDNRLQTAQGRSNETVQQRKARLEDNRIQTAQGRSNESIAQREARLGTNRERNVRSRRTLHADLNRAAFHYDADYDYSGKVKLPELHLPPEPLSTLISGATSQSKHFLRNIRKYNSCFQMTSFGATEIIRDNYIPTFKVQGKICHRVGSLLPLPDSDHNFLQIYFMGNTDDQVNQRCKFNSSTNQEIVSILQNLLDQHNELVRLFKTAIERMPTDDYVVVIRADKTPAGQHERRFNAPTIDEVAILIVGEEFNSRDIVIHRRDDNVQRVSETHRSYDALQYPILFWQGEDGYHFNIKMRDPKTAIHCRYVCKNRDRTTTFHSIEPNQLRALMHFIVKYRVFGASQCWMYSIEWKKRGLPHAHILIWLIDKITPDQIDQVISAEIPDIAIDPDLFEVVAKNMIHGPCGAINNNSPCMKDGKCTKRYPRDLHAETITGVDGYPQYRRRSTQDGGKCITIKVHNIDIEVDNRWIVPYLPLLSRTFKAHINVEYCNSVKSIKYICKYVNKGSDMAVFGVKNASAPIDEVQRYQLGRTSVAMRQFGVFYHFQFMNVILQLFIWQYISKMGSECILQRKIGDLFAKTLRYSDVPKYYTWNASEKKFQRRKQGKPVEGHPNIYSSDALGRLYTFHPSNQECLYLRLLLVNVCGPESFQELRTVNGKVCSTYREACQELYLLENDAHWDTTLADASSTAQPHQIRMLFAILLTTCFPSKPMDLWEKYKDSMSEDILHHLRAANLDLQFTPEIYNRALVLIEDICLAIANKRLGQMGLCAPNRSANDSYDRDLQRETHFDVDDLSVFVERNLSKLVPEQRIAYDTLMQAISDQRGGLYFLDAPGGTGKPFLINLILATIRSRNEIAVAIASYGIAATLLDGGRTAHSALKLPLNLHTIETPTCNISKNSGMGKVLQTCKLIIWDECTMAHKKGLEALDRTLKDLRANGNSFGGALILLSGDFRQTLPVIPRSTPADELNACLNNLFYGLRSRDVRTSVVLISWRNDLESDSGPPTAAKWIKWKTGVPIILLRNINPLKLCNGTRLSVKTMMNNIIEATILNGKFKGQDLLLPRIPLLPPDLPLEFKRLQFPVRTAFSMTINKAQGKSLKVCGLNLEAPCFSHGQLYVASSRVPSNLYVYTPDKTGKTKNVVYLKALD
ncbi:hypothetical protein LAZ67_16000653 [Cordylochernes scorpioides]|uniref:ATP-dependent DNA helicase n=1 Tax=Cordylochernes scorpioides TaxID=51811 RepID=A0ABY6LAR5_9ARAC|nr:hypothetical protein LAZ67_16000653 [Cordylochernes scorpioides]